MLKGLDVPRPVKTAQNPLGRASDEVINLILKFIYHNQDFEAVKHAHEVYLHEVLHQCFLRTDVVMKAFKRIFATVSTFCHVVTATPAALHGLDSGPGGLCSSEVLGKVDACARAFGEETLYLFSILSGVRTHQSSPHVEQFLLRFDYNRFFSHPPANPHAHRKR